MKKLMLILILLPVVVFSQGFKVKQVQNFSGGLVNSYSNSIMDDNMALVLENYDITKVGELKRRRGYSLHYTDAYSGQDMVGLVASYSGTDKKMFTVRQLEGYFGDDRDSLYVLTECDPATEACTNVVYSNLFPVKRDLSYPYSFNFSKMPNELVISLTGSELLLYKSDSDQVYPARLLAPGQIKASILNGGGNITGTVRYKYLYRNSSSQFSNLSAPSWDYTLNRGKNILYNLLPVADSTAVVKIYIYREDNYSGTYLLLDSIDTFQGKQGTYLDNTAIETLDDADTTDFEWGYSDFNRPYTVTPPGGVDVTIDTTTANIMVLFPQVVRDSIRPGETNDLDTAYVGYAVMHEDLSGNRYFGPATWTILDAPDSGVVSDGSYVPHVTNIPVPTDSGITRYLVRSHSYPTTTNSHVHNSNYDYIGNWYTVKLLDDTTTEVFDSTSTVLFEFAVEDGAGLNVCQGNPDFPTGWVLDSTGTAYYWIGTISTDGFGLDSIKGELPENFCRADSLITLQPSYATEHGSRLYSVGDASNINFLWYTDFGRPYNFPSDKFLSINSDRGDWLNGLLSMSNNELVMFKQNSTYLLRGLSFYQYTLDNLIEGVGLSAPNTIGFGNNDMFFLHKTGVYNFPNLKSSISIPIKNTIDSALANINSAWGDVIEGDYWVSLPIGSIENTQTYIYSQFPVPHWKSYSFGLRDAITFDNDTTNYDYDPNRIILLKDNDSLYKWGYSDADTLDDTTHIIATYQSKYFFDNPIRENIKYIDIKGQGICDSLIVSLYDKIDSNKEGILVRTDTISIDFTSGLLNRLYYDNIVSQLSVKIQDFGEGDYTLQGYDIGYLPWDEGKAK